MNAFATSLGAVLRLQQLPAHLPTILLSFLFFTAVQSLLGPWSWRLLGKEREWAAITAADPSLAHRKRKELHNWSTHVTSLTHSLLILPLAFSRLHLPALAADPAFGWAHGVGPVLAVACGYFLWDALDSILYFQDVGFVVHGLACLAIYAMAFKPFLAYYGPRFLLWELSTPFLNIHYFLDKLSLTGSRWQLLNGASLLGAFFGARIVYGGVMSVEFFRTLRAVADALPTSFLVVYGVGNVVLNLLNWVWFFKMISALRRRFQNPERAPRNAVKVPQLQNGGVPKKDE
ncbi:DUF887-domain-containing protein [Gloeophyllum trabeum ATCC 11539]|uniref:DUF887-domain-containing protein n=1 Tax=Gloeophyllum trabeum (strain ATCC 11539 / FP-39264 / Madison 617) TaxID=670483 RepID=S7QDX3_GLOTA|nr:DUF887-domain-containing protein [Gloeophyllum trabeum ATCC 11539]EPQ57986.1 DUF887-domain-containing protein [Gloeophyllum trabeum ATCC 11539]